MWLYILIVVGLAVLVISLAFRVLKGILKIAFNILVVLLVLLAVLGAFILKDFNDFRSNLYDEKNIFILSQDGKTVAGFRFDEISEPGIAYEPLSSLRSLYEKKELGNLEKHGDRLFAVDIGVLSDYEIDDIDYGDVTMTKKDALGILESSSPFTSMAGIYQKNQEKTNERAIEFALREKFSDDESLKAFVFAPFIPGVFSSKNIRFFMRDLKSGRIEIIPETKMFKETKMVPDFVIKASLADRTVKKKADSTKTKIKSFGEKIIPDSLPLLGNVTG